MLSAHSHWEAIISTADILCVVGGRWGGETTSSHHKRKCSGRRLACLWHGEVERRLKWNKACLQSLEEVTQNWLSAHHLASYVSQHAVNNAQKIIPRSDRHSDMDAPSLVVDLNRSTHPSDLDAPSVAPIDTVAKFTSVNTVGVCHALMKHYSRIAFWLRLLWVCV